MNPDRCRQLFAASRVARLGTSGLDRPHLVPVVFALDGDRIVTAVDHKPKRTTRLQRLSNIRANPDVSLLADHYDEDWDRLWWVRADGQASIIESGREHAEAIDRLVDRYDQYRSFRPDGPVVVVDVSRWSGWEASAAE